MNIISSAEALATGRGVFPLGIYPVSQAMDENISLSTTITAGEEVEQ